MRSRRISCRVITPLFSFGADKNKAELRPTELKGLMRYVYRITQQSKSNDSLFHTESEFFGSTKIPSPLRLQMISEPDGLMIKKNSLTLHRKITLCYDGNGKPKKEFISSSIDANSTFDIILRLKNEAKADIQWYENMVRLSLYLSGMGKRTRRARGCVCINNEKEKTAEEIKRDIVYLLNEVANDRQGEKQKVYEQYNSYIRPAITTKENRPVIQKISFGSIIETNHLEQFLTAVDKAGHDTKKDKNKDSRQDPTGTTNFASSIIVSVAATIEGYLPIYTYVKSVYGQREIDTNFSKREKFQEKIESRRRVK